MDACVFAKCVVEDLCHVVLVKKAVVVEKKLEGVIVEGKPTGASDVKVKVEVVVRIEEEVKQEVEVAVEVEMEVLA